MSPAAIAYDESDAYTAKFELDVIGASDPHGRMPEFYGWLHEFVGRCLNASYGRWENFWATEPTSCVRLVDDADVLAKMVYTAANPVLSGLVSDGDQWPGIRLFRPTTLRLERPNGFFRPEGPTPEVIDLQLVPAPVGASSDAQAVSRVASAVAAREAQVRAQFRRDGGQFLGRKAVLAQRVTDSPHTREPRRRLSPRIACRNKWLRIQTLQRCKQFVSDYRDAWRRWCAGAHDVVFPPGTYRMVRCHGVLAADT